METLEKGFLINVISEKNCPGLLVSILEAFEELGLEVLDARVSCSDNFRLQAVSEVRDFFFNLCAYVQVLSLYYTCIRRSLYDNWICTSLLLLL